MALLLPPALRFLSCCAACVLLVETAANKHQLHAVDLLLLIDGGDHEDERMTNVVYHVPNHNPMHTNG